MDNLSRRIEQLGFILVCFFVLSQSFTVPLFTVGPSWATWPTASDLLMAAMIPVLVAHLCLGTNRVRIDAHKRILLLLIVILAGCICSYLILCRAVPIFYSAETGKAAEVGQYQLYRIAQAVLTFAFASQIRLNLRRRRALAYAALTALIVVCTALFLEFLGMVPASVYGGYLPRTTSAAGPWSYYVNANGAFGYGTIGYNHAYSSSQVLLLLVLYLLLNPEVKNFPRAAVVLIAEAAIFASGCRAVLVGSLVFITVLFIRRPRTLAAFACIVLVTAVLAEAFVPSFLGQLGPAADRASNLDPFADKYAGARPLIWADHLEYLDAQPVRWLIGGGFGTAIEEADNAHMMYLQIISETGFLGLGAFLFLFGVVFRQLYRAGPNARPMILGTIAILVASIAQETLYPVPAMGQFIAFYTLSLALALRPVRDGVKRQLVIWTTPGAISPIHYKTLALSFGSRRIAELGTSGPKQFP